MMTQPPPELTPEARAALILALAWQVELGADECIAEAPSDRFAEAAAKPATAKSATAKPAAAPPPPAVAPAIALATTGPDETEAVTEARARAAAAADLPALRAAIEGFDGCALKKGARNTVFSDGNPAARVMFIGEAPSRDEDREGKPFVGRSGQLLDRMLAATGLDRKSEEPETAAYIVNVQPWPPLADRDPSTAETEMLWAFLERHIELANPVLIVTFGDAPARMLTNRPVRVKRERGRWLSPPRAGGRPLLMTLHPESMLRQPGEKAKSWRDLLMLRAALDGEPPRIEDPTDD